MRSAAHIGVIKALLENGVEISAISGTSGGSIVAALYAVGESRRRVPLCRLVYQYNKRSCYHNCPKALFGRQT